MIYILGVAEKKNFLKEKIFKLIEKFLNEQKFYHNSFTTTKFAGNMKDPEVRNNILKIFNISDIVLCNQVHGSNIRNVNIKDAGKFIDNCDGLVTADKNLSLGIFTADCMPILMYCESKNVKAAIHAGWKGLAADIIDKCVNIIQEDFHVVAKDIKVYIAPHICCNCYEVSDEMEKVFNVKLENKKLNLSLIACQKLKKLKIAKDNIFISDKCSFHNENFFSFRKNKCNERMLSVIFN
jgi:YfiH family protein